jgi:hypothetical protein
MIKSLEIQIIPINFLKIQNLKIVLQYKIIEE